MIIQKFLYGSYHYKHLSYDILPRVLLSAVPWNNASEGFSRGQTQHVSVTPTQWWQRVAYGHTHTCSIHSHADVTTANTKTPNSQQQKVTKKLQQQQHAYKHTIIEYK